MRYKDRLYAVTEQKEIVGYDPLGNPQYDVVKTYHPIKCNVEPYSSAMARESYGDFEEVTHRAFTEPSELIKLQATLSDKANLYKVIESLEYKSHYEVLLKKIGSDTDE